MSDLVLYVENESVAAENRTACCPETHINNTTGVGAGGQERITHKDRMYSNLHYIPLPRNFRTRRLRAEAHRGILRRHRQ